MVIDTDFNLEVNILMYIVGIATGVLLTVIAYAFTAKAKAKKD